MVDEHLQRWLRSGRVEDGHAYVCALYSHGLLALPRPEQMFADVLLGPPPGGLESVAIDDGSRSGVTLQAIQVRDADRPASLLVAGLDEARYLFLPQRWEKTPVRMLRMRMTTWPDVYQLGEEGYGTWLQRVRNAYRLGAYGAAVPVTAPSGTAAIELDLAELLRKRWRTAILDADVGRAAGLMGVLDLLLSFRGERSGSVTLPMVALTPDELPDRAHDRLVPVAPSPPLPDPSVLERRAWIYRVDPLDGTSLTHETLSHVLVRVGDQRWSFEKHILWEDVS